MLFGAGRFEQIGDEVGDVMKNLYVALTALFLILVVLCIKNSEPQGFTEEEKRKLMLATLDVARWEENHPPIGKLSFSINKNVMTVHVNLENGVSEENRREIEENIRQSVLYAVMENFNVDESAQVIGRLRTAVYF